jgi:hypothetical protein
MAVKNDETLEEKIATAITETPVSVVPEKGTKPDDEAEFFIRRITEGVSKALAEMMAPKESKPADDEEEVEVEEEGKKVRKRRKKVQVTQQPKKPSFLERLKFPGGK